MTSDRTILIIGVTGNQGGAVAQALKGNGFHLRGLTRRPDSELAAALTRDSIEVVRGDLDDESSLRRALGGAWGGLKPWLQPMSGLPEAKGTTVSRFATHAAEPGVIYAANNRGLFRSDDAGRSWKVLDLSWPQPGLADGVKALACLPE